MQETSWETRGKPVYVHYNYSSVPASFYFNRCSTLLNVSWTRELTWLKISNFESSFTTAQITLNRVPPPLLCQHWSSHNLEGAPSQEAERDKHQLSSVGCAMFRGFRHLLPAQTGATWRTQQSNRLSNCPWAHFLKNLLYLRGFWSSQCRRTVTQMSQFLFFLPEIQGKHWIVFSNIIVTLPPLLVFFGKKKTQPKTNHQTIRYINSYKIYDI